MDEPMGLEAPPLPGRPARKETQRHRPAEHRIQALASVANATLNAQPARNRPPARKRSKTAKDSE